MASERKPLQNFNLDTMSGVYPGSRTMVYQRLRLHRPVDGDIDPAAQWYQLQWYTDPDAATLLRLNADAPVPATTITLPDPRPANLVPRLHDALTQAELQADACYICRHWQPVETVTEDNLPAGRCSWNDAQQKTPLALAAQSALSLACEHFQRLEQPRASDKQSSGVAPTAPRVLKSAELDPDRLRFWPRLWHRLRHAGRKPNPNWADQILERSGVGAGTEPCPVCQGRLANLGALVVASPEGDKQTLSIWRCRSCFTTYFNDWIDRWERLDNLETEERYFRIAPAEAFTALSIIHATKGGDHPGRRADRRQQREQMLALVTNKQPLSHQIRQGR